MKQGTGYRVANRQVLGGDDKYRYGKPEVKCRYCGETINFVRVLSASKRKKFKAKNPDGSDHRCCK